MNINIHIDINVNANAVTNPTQYTKLDKYTVKNQKHEKAHKLKKQKIHKMTYSCYNIDYKLKRYYFKTQYIN